MSVYVGIDVHRKRSQVAVIDQGGEVLANRNVPNGVEPILGVIGVLPGAPGCGRSSWTRDHAPARTGSYEQGHNNRHPHPDGAEVTGPDQHALLTTRASLGAAMCGSAIVRLQ
jgi:hypothetical protein